MDSDPPPEITRCLKLADDMLSRGEFLATRSFAVRKGRSDPSFLSVSNHLTVLVDTLIAGESSLSGSNHRDYYAILQLPPLTNSRELIESQYRNRVSALRIGNFRLSFAEKALQLVEDAWRVFSDPVKKDIYDRELQLSQLGLLGQSEQCLTRDVAQETLNSIVGAEFSEDEVKSRHIQDTGFIKPGDEPRKHDSSSEIHDCRGIEDHDLANHPNFENANPNFGANCSVEDFTVSEISGIYSHRELHDPIFKETNPRIDSAKERESITGMKSSIHQIDDSSFPEVRELHNLLNSDQDHQENKHRASDYCQFGDHLLSETSRSGKDDMNSASNDVKLSRESNQMKNNGPRTNDQNTLNEPMAPYSNKRASRSRYKRVQECRSKQPGLDRPVVQPVSPDGGGTPFPESTPSHGSETEGFWTACPYCFAVYEFPLLYKGCALRCPGCKRAFHATVIRPPPVVSSNVSLSCWGFFPLGFSNGRSGDTGEGMSWSPISAMFVSHSEGKDDGVAKVAKPETVSKSLVPEAPKTLYGEDDFLMDFSDSSEEEPQSDSDDFEWGVKKKRKDRRSKGTQSLSKSSKKQQAKRGRKGTPQSWVDQREVAIAGEGNKVTNTGMVTSGKLDLNVMLNN